MSINTEGFQELLASILFYSNDQFCPFSGLEWLVWEVLLCFSCTAKGFLCVDEFVPLKVGAGCIFSGIHCPFFPKGLPVLTHGIPWALEEPSHRMSPFKAMDAILSRQAALLCFSQLAPGWGIYDFKNYSNPQATMETTKVCPKNFQGPPPNSCPSIFTHSLYSIFLSSWCCHRPSSLFLQKFQKKCMPVLQGHTSANHTTVTRQAVSCSLHPFFP